MPTNEEVEFYKDRPDDEIWEWLSAQSFEWSHPPGTAAGELIRGIKPPETGATLREAALRAMTKEQRTSS